MNTKPRILLIADVSNWVFARHCRMIKRLLSDDFEFTIKIKDESYKETEYDLIYPLEFNLVRAKIGDPSKYITGIRSYTTWRDQDFVSFITSLVSNFQTVHVVSKRLYDAFEPFLPNLRHVAHGVDTDFFRASTRADKSGKGKLRIGWAGNRDNWAKGFEHYVAPLSLIKGVDIVFCGYDSKNLTVEKIRKFYDSIDVYVCSSDSEGNSNSLLEAASMERAIITTDVGTVSEYLCNSKSAIIVERELPNFIQAVVKLREDPRLRLNLGRQARLAVKQRFNWVDRIEDYRAFFQQALKDRFSWQPKSLEFLKQIKLGRLSERSMTKFMGSRYSRLKNTEGLLNHKDSYIRQLEKKNRLVSRELEAILESKRWRYISIIAKIKSALKDNPKHSRKKSR